MTTKLLLISAILVLPLSLMAQTPFTPLKAGASVPDVTLKMDAGKTVSLRKMVSEKPAVLIFYRGGWCPYCTKHLSAVMDIEAAVLDAGYQILAISPDQPAKLAETPDREKLGFTLLSDSLMDASKGFGIAFEVDAATREKYKEYGIDLEKASGQSHYLLPHPAVYVVGTDGVIRFAHVNEDYKVRLEPEKILEAVKP